MGRIFQSQNVKQILVTTCWAGLGHKMLGKFQSRFLLKVLATYVKVDFILLFFGFHLYNHNTSTHRRKPQNVYSWLQSQNVYKKTSVSKCLLVDFSLKMSSSRNPAAKCLLVDFSLKMSTSRFQPQNVY